jgi:hypothetical protein
MSKQTIELDRAYIVNKKVIGPGKVEIEDAKVAEQLKAAVERNKDKKLMGDTEAHQRPDGSLTIMHPEVRASDTVFVTSHPDVVSSSVKAAEEAEEDRAKETQAIRKGVKPDSKAPAKDEKSQQREQAKK